MGVKLLLLDCPRLRPNTPVVVLSAYPWMAVHLQGVVCQFLLLSTSSDKNKAARAIFKDSGISKWFSQNVLFNKERPTTIGLMEIMFKRQ